MTTEMMSTYLAPLASTATDVLVRLLGAVVLWFIGRMVIRMILAAIDNRMTAAKLDETLSKYAQNASGVLLNILLMLAILSVFGVETTTFAGLLAAAGVAIGMAWSGLLSNFAAGAFMVVLRPFKVGDFVEAGGQVGTVMEIGLFVTTIDTMDNVRTIIGNNTIFSGTIKNFTANPFRRVDLVAQLSHDTDPREAIKVLKTALAKIPNVVNEADVHVLEFNLAGPVLCVRPYCHNDNYWQVYFDTNMLIREQFGAAGFGTPEKHYHVSGAGMAVPQ